jgi:hypothetical protein
MKEFLAFLLPPATALVGMRISRFILGKQLDEKFNFGLRFGLGLAVGMVILSQSLLLGALVGVNLCGVLAWTVLIWSLVEVALLAPKLLAGMKRIRFQRGHLWLLILLPMLRAWWVIARAGTIDGTQEFDASAFWILKGRILYLEHGRKFLDLLHTSNLSYTHMDYPLLVPGLYALTYGALGGINEYVIKVWPFWMLVALCVAILSVARVWRHPHPAPILLVVLLCFLPNTLQFVREEGGTMPMVFGTGIAALLLVTALVRKDETALGAGVLALACCAATKLEGVIYMGLWGLVVALFCWRRGWLKNRVLWKALAVAALCLVPYFCVRLEKPVLYPEAAWMHQGATAPGAALARFPRTFFLSVGQRFFDMRFFNWSTTDNQHLSFIGKWQGLDSFAGPELSLLPWLLLLLVGLSFWKQSTHRLALGALLAVILGEFLVLSLAVACLADIQSDLPGLIKFTTDMGRHYYPFFTACFIGTMVIWLLDKTECESKCEGDGSTPVGQASCLSPSISTQKPKE